MGLHKEVRKAVERQLEHNRKTVVWQKKNIVKWRKYRRDWMKKSRKKGIKFTADGFLFESGMVDITKVHVFAEKKGVPTPPHHK